MPGPAPQPTETKRRKGNPGKRALNTREPQPMVGLPMFPDYLPEDARAIWDTLGSELVRNGIMSELDGPALADLVEVEILNRRLTEGLEGTTPVLIVDVPAAEGGANADAKKNPLWAMKLDYLRERRAQHAQFGMTPASRSKIIAADKPASDELEDAIAH
jgi:P27 family predicted phage terminase small subunit